MSNRNIVTIQNDTVQNSPVSGGGHHQIFTGSNGVKFTIKGDIVDNIIGPGKEQVIYQNGKKVGKIYNDTIQNSSVCGGGYQKVISEYDDGYELFSSLIDDLRARFKIFDIIWRIFSIIVVTAIILLILWAIIMFI